MYKFHNVMSIIGLCNYRNSINKELMFWYEYKTSIEQIGI